LGTRTEAPDDKGAWTFEFGEAFEEKFIEYMKRAGVYYADHVRIAFPFGPDGQYQISGEMDVIAQINNEFVIIELKTGHGNNFFKQHIAGYERNHQQVLGYTLDPFVQAPKIEHLLQEMLYLYYGKEMLPVITGEDPIEKSRMIYVARDMCIGAEYDIGLKEISMRHFPDVKYVMKQGDGYVYNNVPLKPFSVEDIFDRFIYTANFVEQGKLPPRDYKPLMSEEQVKEAYAAGELSKSKMERFQKGKEMPMDWQCAYCQFRDLCLQED